MSDTYKDQINDQVKLLHGMSGHQVTSALFYLIGSMEHYKLQPFLDGLRRGVEHGLERPRL